MLVVALVVVVEPGDAHGPLLLATEANINTRGKPDTIGTGIFPLESTVTDVQVYISMSSVPKEYPLPPRVRVNELPDEP